MTELPAKPYVTVTLRKDVVKKLAELHPGKPTSTVVTDAIQEYVTFRSTKLSTRTPDSTYYVSGTTIAAKPFG